MFEQTFLSPPAKTRTVWTVAVSFGAQIVGIGVAVIIPMLAYEHLSPAFLLPPLVAPPTAPAPKTPEIITLVRVPESTRPAETRPFTAPPAVPTRIEMINDLDQARPNPGVPVQLGVIGGVSGPYLTDPSRSIERIVTAVPEPQRAVEPVRAAALPPPVQPKVVVRGGDVQAALLIHRVTPVYPPLARAARISGIVMLHAVISAEGRIRELSVTSGHPMLVQAAVDAVRQWTYRPTLLNGSPVEVITTIEVNFRLGM